jgi:hypothetical protein
MREIEVSHGTPLSAPMGCQLWHSGNIIGPCRYEALCKN